MAVRRNYRINLRNYGNPPAIMVSQYDENYDLVFEAYDGVVPATGLNAYTVKLVGRQPGNDPALKYEFTGTVSGIANNILSFTIDTTMTGRAGKGTAEIVILDTTNDVKFASFNLPVYVEKAAVPDDAIDADVERAQEIADEVQDIVDTAAAEVKGEAEAWAVGQRGGVDVESTDPTYHNNAKYYSEVAQDIADSIGVDATLSVAGKAADAKKTGDEISSLKEDLNTTYGSTNARIQGIKDGKILLPAIFVYGSHTNQNSGEYIAPSTYRITTKTKVHFAESVTVMIADGFRVRRYWFNNNGFVSFDGDWKTGSFTLSPSYSYYINIARTTDDTSEIADISFFASQVYMPFTDTTLSKSGMPADSGTVRERSILRRGEASASDHNNLLSDIFMPGAYLVSPIAFDDTPIKSTANGFLFVFNVNTNFAAQIMYGISAGNKQVYWRSIKANGDEVSPWTTFDSLPVRNVLAVGDSICNGERNANKGFVGDLGIPYVNAGVSGACLSTVRDSDTHWIENQLTSQTREFDAILMEGGINDYIYSAPLGTMSDRPVRRDATDTTPYDSLDTGTVIGALEHLFANCIYKYPDADRFFIITHKTRNYPWVAHFTGGYTQKQLHDAIIAVCELYNVRVIDVYKDSPINTYFKEYYSPTEWSNDNSVGDTEWVDNDQVHPLDYGYLHGYIPLIRDALMSASHK